MNRKIEAGSVWTDAYGETYRVLKVFGRGRNRQVKLDRPLTGTSNVYMNIRSLRIHLEPKDAEVADGCCCCCSGCDCGCRDECPVWMRAARRAAESLQRIGDGVAGTCPECGRVIAVYVPRGGDGSLRKLRAHKRPHIGRLLVSGQCTMEDCPGNGRPAEEWQ